MQTHPLKYLQLLSEKYPSIQAASTAIINFSALLQLPKGTEHFLSDIHGEHEAFQHVVRNGAGSILRKIDEMFSNSMSKSERRNLATLIYYPELKAPLMLSSVPDKDEWSRLTLVRLVKFSRRLSSKYRREAIRKFLPEAVSETIEELLYDQEGVEHKAAYYQSQIDTIVSTGSALTFISCLAELIRHLAVERLHVIGDIYDRGPGAHIILDMLMEHPHVDIQWGNHDILWMGAAAGSEACIANVIRASLRYGNMETLENGYGISILPLASFALETYKDDPCELFIPKVAADSGFTAQEIRLMAQMQKAMAVIQFKVETQVIKRRPHYQMDDRLLLDKIDYERGVITLTASVAAQDGQIGQVIYGSAKAGVNGLVLPLARDLMDIGIRVNSIMPGIFATPLMLGAKPQVLESLAASVPFPKRLGKPEEFGSLALELVRNSYFNAQCLRLDGGIRMAPR